MFGPCPLCGNELLHFQASDKESSADFYNCPQCGKYKLAIGATTKVNLKEKLHLLAGYLYEINNIENFSNIVIPTEKDFLKFLSNPLIPQRISEKPIKLLKYINRKTRIYGEYIEIPPAASYSITDFETVTFLKDLEEKGFVQDESTDGGAFGRITLDGMQYIEQYERQNVTKPDQAFVAMWFSSVDPIPDNVWKKIIQPGCLEAGYNPVKVNDQHFNDNVVDEIIALIKESAFAVVDYSGYRGGVYYEAGYAKGLGKEVINLCHKEWFDDHTQENHAVHFDVNHSNFIVWETGKEEDAKIQLTNRIRATVGKGNYKTE